MATNLLLQVTSAMCASTPNLLRFRKFVGRTRPYYIGLVGSIIWEMVHFLYVRPAQWNGGSFCTRTVTQQDEGELVILARTKLCCRVRSYQLGRREPDNIVLPRKEEDSFSLCKANPSIIKTVIAN